MRAAEIRKTFLDFFAARGHTVLPSSPVVPLDDPTLLFANAGMNQFKGVFTGKETREYTRAATTQKCLRAGGKHNDLENVGMTKRHLTFFEMLGNFSFGDYFKRDACAWAWELVTQGFGLDPKDLWVSVFREDDEARAIWRDEVGVRAERIVGLGEKDNFWSMGDVGPCGPCSEIYIDRGAEKACGKECGLGKCDCDRFLEFWNLVFMQFESRPGGARVPLPRPSIDTGMGLERIAAVLQGADSVFEIDLFRALTGEIAKRSGRKYDPGPGGTPHRVIADHVRSLAFAIADGGYPSNEGRGYVVRRILRRAARFAYELGAEGAFVAGIVPALVREMGDAFPELRAQQGTIEKIIRAEEEQFGRTLRTGMQRFSEVHERMAKKKLAEFPGDEAFFLHDSCGFPIDLTEQMAREKGLSVDRAGFERLMEGQKERSRATITFAGKGSMEVQAVVKSGDESKLAPTEFLGYGLLRAEGRVLWTATVDGGLQLILDRTPFYAESGGQVGDTGTLEGEGFELRILDVQKSDGRSVHRAELLRGDPSAIRPGARVHAAVDAERRADIIRNHTATHLLHAALRRVVGTHVQQKGSLVAPDRLRFDVSHYEKVSSQQLVDVEGIVQEWVLLDRPVEIEPNVPIDEARGRGAMALFSEKYGDRVRVVTVAPGPDGIPSIELCGGTHCARTGEIGAFQVIGEGSVSSGVRRVEALTGHESHKRIRRDADTLAELAQALKARPEEIRARIDALLAENRALKEGKGRAAARDLLAELDAGAGERAQVAGIELVTASWPDAPQEELLRIGDALRRRAGERVFILASTGEDGVRFIVGHSDPLKGRVHCGKIAQVGAKTLGGGGGGRPDLAQAGGKDAAKLPEALRAMREALAGQITAE